MTTDECEGRAADLRSPEYRMAEWYAGIYRPILEAKDAEIARLRAELADRDARIAAARETLLLALHLREAKEA